ncbi:hypothetical protein [Tautonia plasticadhaerens]|uniref:hypothetical protein n=1 Tax=Tautonia plasticadhaerens TaxID=2527974 RepID=UPI0011A7011A|nr:hypothetical protein [Tautonia plasticadhaerens]
MEDVVLGERKVIRKRRADFHLLKGDEGLDYRTGLALSGGGIRSACFNLGMLEALDEQAFDADPELEGSPDEVLPGVEPKGAARGERPRYLELFDYLSSVSGGSYVAGHLATTMVPDPGSSRADRAPEGIAASNSRFGKIEFVSDSVPRWSWAVGVWFVGFAFQVVKTGSLLIWVLGTLALIFRTIDSPFASSFLGLVGMGADVPRGFVPFWLSLGGIGVAFALRNRPRRMRIWLSVCVTVVFLYCGWVAVASHWERSLFRPLPGRAPDWLFNAWFAAHLVSLGVAVLSAVVFLRVKARSAGGTAVGTGSNPKWLFILPLLTLLFCIAGLVTTGDIDVGGGEAVGASAAGQGWSKLLTLLGQQAYHAAIAALGLTSLAFFRWRDLLRSTRSISDHLTASRLRPVYQVVIFLCSYGFLLLLVFVLYGMVAREDVSGFNRRRNAIPKEAFNFRDFSDWDLAWQRIHAGASETDPATSAEGEQASTPPGRAGRATEAGEQSIPVVEGAILDQTSPTSRPVAGVGWGRLAARLLAVRDGSSSTGLAEEVRLNQRIERLDSHPWLRRVVLDAPERYRLENERRVKRDEVARAIADRVLSCSDLYSDILTAESEVSFLPSPGTGSDPGPVREGGAVNRGFWDRYMQRARYLQSLESQVDSGEEGAILQAAIRNNNRDGLRLYLGDLMRVRRGSGPDVIFSSVVWGEDQWARVEIIAISLGIWLLCCLVDVNHFSLHAFYREHVRDRWLGGRLGPSGSGWLHDDRGSYLGLPAGSARIRGREGPSQGGAVKRRAPLLLINATVQGHRALGLEPELAKDIFTFSPVAIGSKETGFWLNGREGSKPSNEFARRNQLDLANLVAISGAFLSPGQVANPALAAILHLLNIRTGLWIRDLGEPPEGGPLGRYAASKGSALEWLGFHVFQSLGIDRQGDRRYLLTDGAHVENLGLKALLDRGCALIVASDCSQDDDPELRLGALMEVLRQARIDGIEIGPFLSPAAYGHWLDTGRLEEFPGPLPGCRRQGGWGLQLVLSRADEARIGSEPGQGAPSSVPYTPSADSDGQATGEDGSGEVPSGPRDGPAVPEPTPSPISATPSGVSLSREHFLFAHVRYCDGAEGVLIYVRPTLTGDEGESLLRRSPESLFPDDPPLDQFYTASRMNTYRLLGRHIGRELASEPEFQRALESIARGESPVPEKSRDPSRPPGDSCESCRLAGSCIGHVERQYRVGEGVARGAAQYG